MNRPKWILIALFLVAAPADARRPKAKAAKVDASGLMAYKVKKGDTCVSIAKKLYGDLKWTSLIHENNSLGKEPHSLRKGLVLHLPPHAPQPATTEPAKAPVAVAPPAPAAAPAPAPAKPVAAPDARLTFLRNVVESYTPEKHAGERNEGLSRGHRVTTLGASSAEVTFVDQSRLQLGEHTLVVILGSSSTEVQSKGSAADTALMKGSLRAHLAELAGGQKKPFAMLTPGVQVTLGAGEAQLGVDDKSVTRLAVYQGSSQLKSKGKEIAVPQGFGSKAEKNKAPTPPRPLPAAPIWTALPSTLAFTDGSPIDINGSYGPGRGAGPKPAQWHVQLARDERMNDLLVDTKVAAAVTALALKQVPTGTWYARVSAVDADLFEGKASDTVKVVVATPKMSLGGEGRPAMVDVPAGLYCGLDGAPLTEVKGPIALAAGRGHELKCAASATGDRTVTKAISLAQSGPVVWRTEPQPAKVSGKIATQDLVLLLSDGSGGPVAGANIVAMTLPDGVTLSPVVASGAPGRYLTTAQYQPRATAIPVRFLVNGADQFETSLSVTDDKQGTGGSAPAVAAAAPGGAGTAVALPEKPRTVVGEVALFASGHWAETISGGSAGPHGAAGGGIEAGVRIAVGSKLGLAIALRGALDQYLPSFDQQVTSLALPISLRFLGPEARFQPYVGILPEVVFQRGVAGAITNTRFGYGAFVGGMLRAGSGGFFLDLGVERAVADSDSNATILTGLYGLLGYRITPL